MTGVLDLSERPMGLREIRARTHDGTLLVEGAKQGTVTVTGLPGLRRSHSGLGTGHQGLWGYPLELVGC